MQEKPLSARRLDLSPEGWTRVVLWAVFGTLGCIVAAIGLDSLSFGPLPYQERIRSIITDIIVTGLIAPPLIIFFSYKLRELAIAHHRLAIYASTDPLTAVLNRGAFTILVDAYLSDLQQLERSGALLVIDVDHFKLINDTLGHDRGDVALMLVAQTIKSVLRSVDLVGRMGGEEFGVFLPGATPLRAEVAAERIRQAISEAEFIPDGVRRSLSVSVGGASFARLVPFETLYHAADRNLYEAKEAGRNRVSFSTVDDDARRVA